MESAKRINHTKNSKTDFHGAPDIVKVFRNYIDSWRKAGGIIYAQTKKVTFNHLILTSKVSFLETKWRITAVYDAIKKQDMDDLSVMLYRKLKSMECVLKSEGFFGRKKSFHPNPALKELKSLIPELKVSKMSVSLYSVPANYPLVSRKVVMEAMEEFYKNPTQITWIIALALPELRGFRYTKKAERIMQLLDEVTKFLAKKTMSLRASLSSGG